MPGCRNGSSPNRQPARVPEPKLIRLNLGLAAKLSIDTDWLQSA